MPPSVAKQAIAPRRLSKVRHNRKRHSISITIEASGPASSRANQDDMRRFASVKRWVQPREFAHKLLRVLPNALSYAASEHNDCERSEHHRIACRHPAFVRARTLGQCRWIRFVDVARHPTSWDT